MATVHSKSKAPARRNGSPARSSDQVSSQAGGAGAATVQMEEKTSQPVLGAFYESGPALSLNGNGSGHGANGHGAPAAGSGNGANGHNGAGGVQFKLAISRPGDPYEREADAAADRVTSGGVMPAITPLGPGALSRMATLQREAAGEEEEQPRQAVVQPCENCDDEKQGNVEPPRVQRQAVQENHPEAVQPCENCDQEREEAGQPQALQRRADGQTEREPEAVQPCENCDQEGGEAAQGQDEAHDEPANVQAASDGGASSDGSGNVAGAISHPGAGAPLAPSVRSRLEPGLGADLSGVRVHHDAEAHSAAHSLKARAFTHGQDIWLGPGESPTDTRLMAHETTHVVQQISGAAGQGRPVQRQLVANAERQFEAAAVTRAEDQAGAGEAPAAAGAEPAGPPAAAAPAEGAGAEGNAQQAAEAGAPAEDTGAPEAAAVAGSGGAPAAPTSVVAGGPGSAPAASGAGEAATADAAGPATAPAGPTPGASGGAAAASPATQSETSGSGERVGGEGAGGGAVNATCYEGEEIEEPDPEPKEQPQEPEATEAEENMDSESPDAEEVDDCPAEDAIAAQAAAAAPAGGSLQGEAAAMASAGAAEGESITSGAELGPAAAAGGPEAGASAEAAGAGDGGAAAGEAAPMPSSVESSIGQLEAQRAEAVAAYGASSALLAGAGAGASDMAGAAVFAAEPSPSPVAQMQRIQAQERAHSFFQQAAERMDAARDLAMFEVPDRLGSLAEAQKAAVGAAMETEKAAISERIAVARSQAVAAAAGARARVNAGHDAAVAAMEAETTAAIDALTVEHEVSFSQVDETESNGLDAINTLYADSRRAHEEAGVTVGNEAIARGEEYVAKYHTCRKNAKDSFWAGYLTDRRAEAQKNAARETAKGYRKSLEKAGKDQARQVVQGRKQDRCTLIAAGRQARSTVDDQYDALITALESGLEQAKQNAASTRDGMLASIDSALSGNLRQLDQQEQSQRQAANDTGYLQQVAIEQAAHSAAASLQSAVAAALSSLQEALGQVRGAFVGETAPDGRTLDRMLSQTFGAIQAGLNRLESQVDGGTAQSEARLVSTGVQALGALANVTASNDQMATSASDSFSGSMASLAANAESTFNTQTAQVTQQTQSTRDGGIAGLQQAVAGFETEATRITTNVETALNNSLQELNRSLQESKAGMDDEAHGIPKQAREAASHEAPAWKTVVKWVLIIAIIVVVAVVAGPAVIGAIGGAAAALGASAGAAAFIGAVVGGAIVGAATSAAIQVLNNWETNQGFGKGVLRAAAIGALTGAIGGAAGFGVGKLMENAGRLTQFGANLASDAVLEVGTELVQGDLSWDNFGQAMVMTLFTAGLGEFGPVRRMQARATHAGASSVPGGRAAAYAESIRPRTAAETEGAAPAAPRPEAEGAAPAAPRPEAEGAAPAAPRPEAEGAAPAVPRPEAEGAAPAVPRPEAEGAAPAAPRPEAEGAAPAAPRQEAEGGASRLGDEMSSTRTEAKVESTAPRSSIEPEAPKTSSEAEAETGKPRGEAEEGAGSSRGSHEDDPAAGRRPVGEEDVTAGQRVVAEVETVGGHRLKILEDGTVAICTTCTTLKLGYGPELARRPDLRRRLGAAQRVKDGRARAERIKDIHRELVIERIRGVPGEIQIDPRTKEYLRKRTPSTEVQNRVNAGEAVDAVYGHKVNGTLAADHIVPFNDLISMPGFTRLSLDNQLKILNDVHNFVGLDPRVNSSKGAKSWADWQGHPDFGQITPSMRRRFRARELRTRNRLQEKINDLLLQQEGI